MFEVSEKNKSQDEIDQSNYKRKRVDDSDETNELIDWCKRMDIFIDEKKVV